MTDIELSLKVIGDPPKDSVKRDIWRRVQLHHWARRAGCLSLAREFLDEDRLILDHLDTIRRTPCVAQLRAAGLPEYPVFTPDMMYRWTLVFPEDQPHMRNCLARGGQVDDWTWTREWLVPCAAWLSLFPGDEALLVSGLPEDRRKQLADQILWMMRQPVLT